MKRQTGILPGKIIFGVFEILFIVWIATRTVIGTLALIICVLSIIAIIVIPYKIRNRARPVVFETKKKKLYPELDDRDINKTRYPLTISDEYAENDDMMPGYDRHSEASVKILPADRVLVNISCINCGGNEITKYYGRYYCEYCGSVYIERGKQLVPDRA